MGTTEIRDILVLHPFSPCFCDFSLELAPPVIERQTFYVDAESYCIASAPCVCCIDMDLVSQKTMDSKSRENSPSLRSQYSPDP